MPEILLSPIDSAFYDLRGKQTRPAKLHAAGRDGGAGCDSSIHLDAGLTLGVNDVDDPKQICGRCVPKHLRAEATTVVSEDTHQSEDSGAAAVHPLLQRVIDADTEYRRMKRDADREARALARARVQEAYDERAIAAYEAHFARISIRKIGVIGLSTQAPTTPREAIARGAELVGPL